MAQVVAADGVIVHEEEGDAFLLDVASGHYYGLNRSGLVIWTAIVDGGDPVEALRQRWPNVPAADLEADAAELIGGLRKAGLVRDAAAPPPPPG